MRRSRWIKGILFIAVAAGLGYGAWMRYAPARETDTKTQNIATVARGNVEQVVTAQGKLEPKNAVAVGAQVSGQLEKLHVDIGDVVEKDSLIAEIDPEIYETKVEADLARLKTLGAQKTVQEAEVRQAEQKYERNKRLLQSKAVAQEVFQDAETALDIARANLTALESQIEEANSTLEGDRANLNYTRIYAPIGGTVVTLAAKEGETLNANQTTPTIVEIADLDTMTARAQVAEADITKLKTGMDVYFTTLGSQGRRWSGTVRQILPTPETINDVVLYNVLVDADNKDRQLMSGMTTQMFFVLDKAEDVPVVPVAALLKRDREAKGKGAAYVVKVIENGQQTEKTIFVGATDRQSAQVLSGIDEGVNVVVPAPAAVDAKDTSGTGRSTRRMTPRL